MSDRKEERRGDWNRVAGAGNRLVAIQPHELMPSDITGVRDFERKICFELAGPSADKSVFRPMSVGFCTRLWVMRVAADAD